MRIRSGVVVVRDGVDDGGIVLDWASQRIRQGDGCHVRLTAMCALQRLLISAIFDLDTPGGLSAVRDCKRGPRSSTEAIFARPV